LSVWSMRLPLDGEFLRRTAIERDNLNRLFAHPWASYVYLFVIERYIYGYAVILLWHGNRLRCL